MSPATRSLPPGQQEAHIRREPHGRGGKTVTVVYNLHLSRMPQGAGEAPAARVRHRRHGQGWGHRDPGRPPGTRCRGPATGGLSHNSPGIAGPGGQDHPYPKRKVMAVSDSGGASISARPAAIRTASKGRGLMTVGLLERVGRLGAWPGEQLGVDPARQCPGRRSRLESWPARRGCG